MTDTTNDTISDTINDAINNYYKLKQTYDDKLNKQKQKILKDQSLSIKEKKQKWLREKKRCLVCKKSGGTIFKNENNILSAVCGSSNPCKLNININKGYYSNIRTDYLNLHNEIKSIHTEIIDIKLQLLFNYIDEDKAIKLFEKLRKNLKLFTTEYDRIHLEYLNIVNYGMKNKKLDLLHTNLFIHVQSIKDAVKSYEEEHRNEYISNIVETYTSRIIPLVKKIMEETYRKTVIENDMETLSKPNEPDRTIEVTKLVQSPYTLKDLYVLGSEKPKIISNIF